MEKVDIYKVTYRIDVPHLQVSDVEQTIHTPFKTLDSVIDVLKRHYTDKVKIHPESIHIEKTNIRNVYFPTSIKHGAHAVLEVVKFVTTKMDVLETSDDKVLFRVLARSFANAHEIVDMDEELKSLLPVDKGYRVKTSIVGVLI